MNAEFIEALNAIEKERGISKDILIDAFESALIAAYKRNYGAVGNVRATVDRDTGEVQIFASKTVTETVENPYAEISLAEAKKINSLYEVGDVLEVRPHSGPDRQAGGCAAHSRGRARRHIR